MLSTAGSLFLPD